MGYLLEAGLRNPAPAKDVSQKGANVFYALRAPEADEEDSVEWRLLHGLGHPLMIIDGPRPQAYGTGGERR